MSLVWQLNKKQPKSNLTIREHLERVEKATGRRPKKLLELDQTKRPAELDYVLAWFWMFYVGERFKWSDLTAWCQLNNITLQPWESDLIRCLSILRYNHQ